VQFLKTIYAGATSSKGEIVFPGHEPGAELGSGGWQDWILGEGPGSGAGSGFFQNYFRYMVYDDPAWNPFNATVDAALHAANEKTAQALNSTDPDLHSFQARGGKLILYHGWDDPAIAPQNTINYYQSVQQKLGPSDVSKFVRLYMVPGMQHCIGGPGPSIIGQFGTSTENDGAFGAMKRWVEAGSPPADIIASKYHTVAGKAVVEMTRPICPYPEVATYKGSGDTNDSHNFACSAR
jgi:feruloyl esterase